MAVSILLPLNCATSRRWSLLAIAPTSMSARSTSPLRTIREPVYFLIAETPRNCGRFLTKHYPVPQFLAQYAEKL